MADQLDQYVLDHWPDTESAMWSQIDIAKSSIDSNNLAEAQAAIDKLFANHPGNEHVAKAIHDIAYCCRQSQNYKRADRIDRYVLEYWPGTQGAMWAHIDLSIKPNIDSGNLIEAQAGIAQLLADYSGQEYISSAIYTIPPHYRNLGEYDKARELYQCIIDRWPDSDSAVRAKVDMAVLDISSLICEGRNSEVLPAIDKLIADFNDYPGLPEAIFSVGEEYYSKARSLENEGLDEQAKGYYREALAVWERIIQELSASAAYTPRAYYCSAVVHSQELNEYNKGIEYYQHIVDNWPDYQYAWHAQYFVGMYYERLLKSGGITESEANPKIEQAYKAVIEKYPDSKSAPHAAIKLARLNFNRAQWADAAMYFELFLQRLPQKLGSVVLPLGRAYEEMGELDSAAEVYSEFIKTADPNEPHIEAVKARLEELGGQN